MLVPNAVAAPNEARKARRNCLDKNWEGWCDKGSDDSSAVGTGAGVPQ